jgi:hypothetical protein
MAVASVSSIKDAPWLLLMHQLPPKPDYLRVKVRRRLQKLGAALVKNSVYVLPNTEEHLEDFQWLANEIIADGGEAAICAASWLAGLDDDDMDRMLTRPAPADADVAGEPRPRGATWVTRKGVFVDRIASAWLIRRFIDPDARFKFVSAAGYKPLDGELRFDMYRGEYTHEGDSCTFETLLRRFQLEDPALAAIAEIVHDLDLKDDKFERPEASGVLAVLKGITADLDDDAQRLSRGALVFDGLYAKT